MFIETNTAVKGVPCSPAPAAHDASAAGFRAAIDAAEKNAAAPAKADRRNDAALAALIGGGDDISTEKAVNWSSKGDKELTAEQIARLKETYDVNNLTRQDYYDLMSDLTQMEVLAGEDCMGVHLATAPPPGRYSVPVGYSSFGGQSRKFQGGSLLDYFSDVVNRMTDRLAEFRRLNPGLSGEWMEKDLASRQRMLELLTRLQ